ncbi:hypothetical protein CL176_02325 [Suicoccus acidiformans]|uniref:PTS EIIB type-1 domain-containing protein n=1 Tax=Suicoccus acidiformans TaxID=2036206 RepID=A0A347WIP7_9LACT|nr:PTS glucose/sucrose transporter subunit IIB [Suicoccus acidiformans]AXY24954.1 hypothetical protein CL176_02325 [Suicoccus acidiformans]
MDNSQIATQIVENIGKENIIDFTKCATRLRFKVKDESIINSALIEALDGVSGTTFLNNQFQVFVALGKIQKVFEEVKAIV